MVRNIVKLGLRLQQLNDYDSMMIKRKIVTKSFYHDDLFFIIHSNVQ